MRQTAILVAFLLPLFGYSQVSTLTTLYATEDAYTSSGSPSVAYGSYGTLEVSKTASSTFRSFLKFDLSSIPANAVITSAVLRLIPSGTEGLSATDTTGLYLDVCNTAWTEAGITHASGIANNTLYPTVTVSKLVSGKREFQIKDFVQAIADNRMPNMGWRIRRSNETTNQTNVYYSRENGTVSNRPQLDIQYYIRSYVSAATITHTTTLTSTDGAIAPTVVNGSSTTKTFRWYNASGTQIATTQNLSGVGKGWYGLKYYGTTTGDTTYQAFVIGTECEEISLTFDPGPNYIDDATTADIIRDPTSTTVIIHNYANSGGDVNFRSENWTWDGFWGDTRSLMRFRLWVDPAMQVNSAQLTLTGNAHYPLSRSNQSELDLVTGNWTETGVTFYNQPTYSSTGKILIAGVPSGNTNVTTDISGFFNTWKNNNVANNGMLLQLQSFTDQYTRMQFHSSDAAVATNRPKIVFTIKTNTCDLTNKGTVTISDNDAALKKRLSVSLKNLPTWAVAPYRYVVSDQAIPDPRGVLKYLNDSVFDPDLDSTQFFKGNVSASSFNFGDLEYGTYNVAAFDNNGKRIFEKTGVELYPALTLLATSNTVVLDNTLIRPNTGANAICEINAFVNTNSQGTVKINPTALSGNQYYGFLDATTTLSSNTNIRYGYKISGSNMYTIINSRESSNPVAITATSNLILSFVNDTIIYTNDSVVVARAPLAAGYSFKLGGILNTASRTRIRLIRVPLKPFFFVNVGGTERTCDVPTSNFQFNITGFLSSQFGSYTYQLAASNTNESVSSFSGTGTNNGTVTVNNVPPGVYTLTCTQSSGSTPITLTYPVYIGVQASWFSTRPNYNLSPNSYSLQRDNVNPILSYSSALSTNILSSGTKGWIWFNPVVGSTTGLRNDYLTIADNFGNLQAPGATQTYLSFRRLLPTLSAAGGLFVSIPGGLQITWRDATTSISGSATVPLNAFVTVEMTGTAMNVKANNTLITSITQPGGFIRLKANSNRSGEGFKDVHTTFVCTANQTIDQVGYYELARDYTAGYATAITGKLKFTFDEEYAIVDSGKLRYVVYDDSNIAIASGDMSGSVTGGATALTYNFDDNRYILNVASISAATAGKYYHLEVTTSTGQKRYLRFLYKN